MTAGAFGCCCKYAHAQNPLSRRAAAERDDEMEREREEMIPIYQLNRKAL